MSRRAALIVLDGLGVGPAHDTDAYGDTGSNTLGNVLKANPALRLPNLEALGLGGCGASGVRTVDAPTAAWGSAQPTSAGKDSTSGHWELCGLPITEPFPTYPNGFPAELLAEFSARTGRGVLGNRTSSGTAILDDLAAEHVATGSWIVYTSADSVFQIAAHEDLVPIEELYEACRIARELLVGEHGVSRVIARPFVGKPGGWIRTKRRKDYSRPPLGRTLLDALAEAHIPVVGVGKVDDLFAGRNIRSIHTATNAEAYELIEGGLLAMRRGFLFANVIEFDQSWGHRNDVPGFAKGLEALDRWIPRLKNQIRPDDLIILTADHGNDPTTPSTDHSREQVPVLVLGGQVRPVALGVRSTFADLGQTVAEFLGVPPLAVGTSFLTEVWAT
ncbi:MAG: phosphopentomutase [Gemmatimonadales bacterium]|nr:phosphopentomutase [Gemmatimonadales bacterium]MDZ4389729.1 phosphopentomutase [Gemmatimonadales bacterium]